MNATAQATSAVNIKLYNPHAREYSDRISEAQWNKHKLLLTELHGDRVSRSDMLRILKDEHDFAPSSHQLNTKLAQWGLQVYTKTRKRAKSLGLLQNLIGNTRKRSSSTGKASVQDNKNAVSWPTRSVESHPNQDEVKLLDNMIPYHVNIVLENSEADIDIAMDSACPLRDVPSSQDQVLSPLLSTVEEFVKSNNPYCDAILYGLSSVLYASRMYTLAFKLLSIHRKTLVSNSQASSAHIYKNILYELDCIGSATTSEQVELARIMMDDLITNTDLISYCSDMDCCERQELLASALRVSVQGNRDIDSTGTIDRILSESRNVLAQQMFMRRHFVQEVSCSVCLSTGRIQEECVHSYEINLFARQWSLPLELDSCAIWEVLQTCLFMIEDFDAYKSGLVSPLRFPESDNDVNLLSTALGCHFMLKYAATIRHKHRETYTPLWPADRAFMQVDFKCKIRAMLTFAAWTAERSRQRPQWQFTIDSDGTHHPSLCNDKLSMMCLKEQLQDIKELPSGLKTSGFNRVYESLFHVDLRNRQENEKKDAMMDTRLPLITHTMDAALELGRALDLLTRSVCNDPIIGSRADTDCYWSNISHKSPTASFHSYARQVANKGFLGPDSCGSMSPSRTSTSHRSWKFSTVTGFSSPQPSIKASGADSIMIDV